MQIYCQRKKRKADILLMKKISSDHPDDVDEDALDELMKSFLMNLIKTSQKRLKLSITSFLVLGKQVFISTFLRKSGANKKRKYIFNLSELYIPPPVPIFPMSLLQTYELGPKSFCFLVVTLLPHWSKISKL